MKGLATFGGRLASGPLDSTAMTTRRIALGGRVQGVGYRPFVFRLAQRCAVSGWVRNGLGTVEILASGTEPDLDRFASSLFTEAPPAAQPVLIGSMPAEPDGTSGFVIRESAALPGARHCFPPDLAPCPDCLKELSAPRNRRRGYPFINCTQCGPRYSLIRALPYDRANTAMTMFAMCSACSAEYLNPLDRRFHAEPIACPECGPTCLFVDGQNPAKMGSAAVDATIAALRNGKIVAVKGVGGYHLFCDAANEAAVVTLRHRKLRPHKPFALLFPENQAILERCAIADFAAVEQLRSTARPIVLLDRRADAPLAPSVAPGVGTVGAMLADSPLHHLIAENFSRPLVATSANRSGEPMLTTPEAAVTNLAGIADAFLHHNRPIERPVDDSVVRIVSGLPRAIRAGRGMCPLERDLPFRLAEPVLALGGHMKSTVALAFENRVIISPHLGDLDNAHALASFVRMIGDLQSLYDTPARRLLVDAHSGYASTAWAKRQGLEIVPIWHHHAHASAVAGEGGQFAVPMLVFTWDGVGLGPDGTLWGGEALLGMPGQWHRVARFRQFRLQGGDAVGRELWRSAAALCWEERITPPLAVVPPANEELARLAWQKNVNCHVSSAAGRLFDAASTLLGLCYSASFEGQGPALLEALAGRTERLEAFRSLPLYETSDGLLEANWGTLLPMLLDPSLAPSNRAARFHGTLAATAIEIVKVVGARHKFSTVGLGGGVFQNRLLSETLIGSLNQLGYETFLGKMISCNDAGLSFGQIVEFGGQS